MDSSDIFELIPIWAVFALALLLALASVELGYRWARRKQRRAAHEHEQEKEAPVGAMVGATLGLLAFLLAFTFGMAADEFHERKLALLDEASAIETAYLRAGTVTEPHRTEVRKLLREYVEERLQRVGGGATARPATVLLRALWQHTEAAVARDPGDITGLFEESVNDIITLKSEQLMVRERSRIPAEFWLMLHVIAAVALAAMGYHGGVAGTARSPVTAAVALTFALVMVLIADIDRPGEGWIEVPQDAMLDLRTALAEEAGG